MKRLTKNRKGVSPVIATILLILIAIAAGVVVYSYAIGWLGASTQQTEAPQEVGVSIDLAGYDAVDGQVDIYFRNIGTMSATVDAAYVLNSDGEVIGSLSPIGTLLAPGESSIKSVDVTLLPGTYILTAKVVATDGSGTVYTLKATEPTP